MAVRKTDPEPLPVRGTPSGYRDRWEADDEAVIEALTAERERLIVAARESAAPYRCRRPCAWAGGPIGVTRLPDRDRPVETPQRAVATVESEPPH